ncbi:MAG: acyl-CoA thioesterase [Rhodovibrionaceae bacterium]
MAENDVEAAGFGPSETRMLDMVFPGNTNHYGTLFAGNGMSLMGKAAFITATRYARKAMVLRSARETDFLAPVRAGELIELIGRVTERGNSSVQVEVEMVSEGLTTGERRSCCTGRFTLVAVDEDGRAVRLTPKDA